MKKKYLIGIIVGIVFVILAIYSFDSSKIEYSDFSSARKEHKTVQIIGSWVKELPSNYDNQKNEFKFHLKDEKNETAEVLYNGGKPNNFDIAPMVVVKGKFEGDIFIASEVLTKCPSKYEGKMQK
ncbi:MAG: cytochrome c maturation protein CcmE [Ignavibacteria bacterium]|jgi:cytochrome c-type biogenesis protein CcmE|nr:cytochrome c maturation protein CcmE [Ignavibacteria bacterium]